MHSKNKVQITVDTICVKKMCLLTSRNVDMKLKKILPTTYVWMLVLRDNYTWSIRKSEENKLVAFEVWCYRKITKTSWVDRMANEEVIRRVGEERSFLIALNIRRAKLISLTLRHKNLLG